MMRKRKEESDGVKSKTKQKIVLPVSRAPPPPPPLPKFRGFSSRPTPELSVTKREIARFWRQKRIEEEDHLLAAIKAAARLRARNLTEQEYLSFEESLENDREEDGDHKGDNGKKLIVISESCESKNDVKEEEVRVGIKDWWTKSKYAYLNQPAIDSKDPPKKRASSYTPNCLSYKPKPFYPTSIGVF